jgi:hypothetical protein
VELGVGPRGAEVGEEVPAHEPGRPGDQDPQR